MALGRAGSRVENLRVTMKSNSFVTHQIHLLSWMVFANLWVSFYQRSVRVPPTNHHCATMQRLSALMVILGPSKRFLVCSESVTLSYTFFLVDSIALGSNTFSTNQFHCPFIQLVLQHPRKRTSASHLAWKKRRMLRVHVLKRVLV